MKNVLLYSTRWCPYCIQAKRLLNKKGIQFKNINISDDAKLRTEMQQKSGRNTVPQIFIDDTHIGGCDELYTLDAGGALDKLLSGNQQFAQDQAL